MMDNQEANADSLPEETSSDSESQIKATINLPADKAYDLLRLDVIKGVQDELLAWGKKRFWVLSVGIIVFGSFGGIALLSVLVDRQVDSEIERYKEKFNVLNDEATKSRFVAEEAANAADSVGTKVVDIDKQAAALETRVASVNNRLANATTENLEISEDIRSKVAQLAMEVAGLADAVDKLAKGLPGVDIQTLVDRIGNIESSLNQSQAEIIDAGVRAERGRYTIEVTDFEGTVDLVRQLESHGFPATIYLEGQREIGDQFSAIWVGTKIPVDVAAPVIKMTKQRFPFIKYLFLEDESFSTNSLYIGASTAWAAGVVSPLTNEDFQRLTDSTQSQEAFHLLLESFELPSKREP